MLDRRGSLAISNQKSKCGNSDNFQYYSIFYHFWNYSQHAFALSKTWLGIIYMQLLKKLFPLPNLATVLPTNPVRVLHAGVPEKRIPILQTTDSYSIKTCQKSLYKKATKQLEYSERSYKFGWEVSHTVTSFLSPDQPWAHKQEYFPDKLWNLSSTQRTPWTHCCNRFCFNFFKASLL